MNTTNTQAESMDFIGQRSKAHPYREGRIADLEEVLSEALDQLELCAVHTVVWGMHFKDWERNSERVDEVHEGIKYAFDEPRACGPAAAIDTIIDLAANDWEDMYSENAAASMARMTIKEIASGWGLGMMVDKVIEYMRESGHIISKDMEHDMQLQAAQVAAGDLAGYHETLVGFYSDFTAEKDWA